VGVIGRIHLVVGDIRPVLYVQLRQPTGLLDVSVAQVFLRFKPYGQDLVLFQLTGDLLPGTLQADLVTADLTQYPIAGTGGRVRFQFAEGNLIVPAGIYFGEIEVFYAPGNSFTLYPRLEFQLREAA
jgi:hypothetical protein